ncbi:hypothetical protein RDI58_014731 [Solanum bulbocastanum]|uniref:Uncharacterized protein n=1 Tax=Solanum bulbocastanum TaxID=147425 RepID=A0AAN8YC62_SOLBU
MGVAIESVNGTKALNLVVNQNMEYTPNCKSESKIQEQDQLITRGPNEANSQRKHQGDQGTTQRHTQVLQHTNDMFYTGDSTEKQQDKTEKAIWKVKEKTNTNETTINSNKEKGGNRPHTNSMEKTGKSVNFASENNAHNPLILNNQNEQEKGHLSM